MCKNTKTENYEKERKTAQTEEKIKLISKRNYKIEILDIVKRNLKKFFKVFRKKVKEKSIVTVIGNYGSRKNNFCSYIV